MSRQWGWNVVVMVILRKHKTRLEAPVVLDQPLNLIQFPPVRLLVETLHIKVNHADQADNPLSHPSPPGSRHGVVPSGGPPPGKSGSRRSWTAR